MKSQTTTTRGGRRALLVALLLAGIGLNGVAVHAGIAALTDPMMAFSYRLRLPGERSLWLSKRPACRPPLPRMRCRYFGRTADSRLWVSSFAPASRRVEYTFRLPQRSGPVTPGSAGER